MSTADASADLGSALARVGGTILRPAPRLSIFGRARNTIKREVNKVEARGWSFFAKSADKVDSNIAQPLLEARNYTVDAVKNAAPKVFAFSTLILVVVGLGFGAYILFNLRGFAPGAKRP